MQIEIPIVPKNGVSVLAFDMARIYQAERRNDEIGSANEHKAPELMAFFNRAYIDATDYSNALAAEILRAQKVAERRKSTVILDEVPRVLREKGLVPAGSAKVSGTILQQEAILTQDAEYQAAIDLVDGLKHYKDLMDRKMKTIENMYLGVRKLIGGDRLQWMPRTPHSGTPASEGIEEHSWSENTVLTPSPYVVPVAANLLPADPPQPRGLRASFGSPRD
jgi:hypothetical protein